jgi:ACR3 family arsenite transporter
MAKSAPNLDEHGRALLEEDLRSPCTEEIAVFSAFAQTVERGENEFVVLDTAPTGHTLLLLDAAEAYHREVSRTMSDLPEAVRRLLPRLRDAEFTRVMLVALPEATPVHEAARLQDDLLRAGIKPFAWVVNQSFSRDGFRDPVLVERGLRELRFIAEVRDELADRFALISWKPYAPVGPDRLREIADMGESTTQPQAEVKRLNVFERYLTLWVGLCMVAGVMLGKLVPGVVDALRRMEFGSGSQINVPIAVLIWLMIIPMMMKVDFTSIKNVGKRPRGLLVTLFVNWLVKPFSMALIGWLFFRILFSAWISPAEADQYIAGVIILAAAPCTAMVFVWSYLTDGDPAYTLVQVSVNDLIMLVLFAPIVRFLVSGASSLSVPFLVLLYSVVTFIVIPLTVGTLLRRSLIHRRGKEWFETSLMPRFAPVTIAALLATLVFIFAFQADNITGKSFHVVLIAIPILIQVYFNSSLTYGLMRLFRVEYSVAAPGALIGASNFFELAVATAIALVGPGSGAALATVVGVLVEVPVMLSVCAACNRTRHWFAFSTAGREV